MQTEFSAGCGKYSFFICFLPAIVKKVRVKKMSVEYCAYPFLKEESRLCDYEIATDRLASMPVSYTHLDVYKRQGMLTCFFISCDR